MIQFNLLPDVKLDYIRLRRLKRMMIGASSLVAATSVVIALVLFSYVNFGQKSHMNNLEKDITKAANTITNTKDIDKKITVQNQLLSLPALHEEKPRASNLFTYLSQITPADTTITTISIDFVTNTITLSGNSPDLLGVNRFIDTLKFTSYSAGEDQSRAFTNVLLASFSPGEIKKEVSAATGSASFQATFAFDPIIFDNQKDIKLNVPNTITTRSQLSQPRALFQSPIVEEEE